MALGSSLPGSFSDNVVLLLPALGPPKPPVQGRHASAQHAGKEDSPPENVDTHDGMTDSAAEDTGEVAGGHAAGAGADEDSTQGIGSGVRRCFHTAEDLGPRGGAGAFRAALSVQDLHTQQYGGMHTTRKGYHARHQ